MAVVKIVVFVTRRARQLTIGLLAEDGLQVFDADLVLAETLKRLVVISELWPILFPIAVALNRKAAMNLHRIDSADCMLLLPRIMYLK